MSSERLSSRFLIISFVLLFFSTIRVNRLHLQKKAVMCICIYVRLVLSEFDCKLSICLLLVGEWELFWLLVFGVLTRDPLIHLPLELFDGGKGFVLFKMTGRVTYILHDFLGKWSEFFHILLIINYNLKHKSICVLISLTSGHYRYTGLILIANQNYAHHRTQTTH